MRYTSAARIGHIGRIGRIRPIAGLPSARGNCWPGPGLERVENRLWARKNVGRMCGLISRLLGVLIFGATILVLGGCEFGSDNVGDIYGSNQSQDSGEHSIPASQQTGTVTGEPGQQTSRY
jgi:hypothetical protein